MFAKVYPLRHFVQYDEELQARQFSGQERQADEEEKYPSPQDKTETFKDVDRQVMQSTKHFEHVPLAWIV